LPVLHSESLVPLEGYRTLGDSDFSLGLLDGLLRWIIGNHRMVYKIDEEKRLVVLLDVGPRKAIYD
jgi:hypothetical protein